MVDVGESVAILTGIIIAEAAIRTLLLFMTVGFKTYTYEAIKRHYERRLTRVLYLSKGRHVILWDEDLKMIRQEIDASRIKKIGAESND